MEPIEWIIQNKEWLFSGIGVTILYFVFGYLFQKKSAPQYNSKMKASENGQINYGNGNHTPSEIKELHNTSKHDSLLICYIDHIIEYLTVAYHDMENIGVANSDKWYHCIEQAVLDDSWKSYIDKSSLSGTEVIELKKWFYRVIKLIDLVTKSQGIIDTKGVRSEIYDILKNQCLAAIRNRLDTRKDNLHE